MTDESTIPDAPIPGVTPRGWYADPTSPTGERAWTGKRWALGTKRPSGIPLGPTPSFSDMLATRQETAAARAADRFAMDHPDLADQAAGAPVAPAAPAAAPARTPAPLDESALNAEVAKYARQGYTVTDRSPGQVILQRKKPIGVFYVLVMILLAVTIIGLLLLFPILRAVNGKKETIVITLDDKGKPRVRKS